MQRHTPLTVLISFLMLLSLSFVTNTQTNPTCGLSDTAFRDAVQAGGTVTLQPANCVMSFQQAAITIASGKSTTIKGENATITITSANGLFDVAAGGILVVEDMTIQNGTTTAINNAGTLTIRNSILTNNKSSANAGGAVNTAAGSQTTIEGSLFTVNSSAGNGGAIENEGSLNITNSSISSNVADDGGGIYNVGGTVTIDNSSISSNHADTVGHGGGIYSTGTVTISNSTIAKNTGGTAGTVQGQGGGIYTTGTLTLTQSTVFGNHSYTGGGIYAGAASIVSVTYSTIVCNQPLTTSVTLGACGIGTTVDHDGSGGGIYGAGGAITLYQSVLTGNFGVVAGVIEAVDCTGTTFSSSGYNVLGENGSANGCTTTGTDITVAVGKDKEDIFYLSGEALPGETQDPNITPVFDLDNYGGATLTLLPRDGGAAVDAGDPNPVSITDADQRGEIIGADGHPTHFRRIAGTVVDIGATEFQDSRLTNYTVTSTADNATICSSGTGCSLRGAVIAANRTLPGSVSNIYLAAGIYTLSLTGDDDEALVGDLDILVGMNFIGSGTNTTIIQTCADVNACSLNYRAFDIFQGSVYFSNLTIQNVRTAGNGGAIHNQGGSVGFSGVTFKDNQAGTGGAIYNDADFSLSVFNSHFIDNKSATDGGAIYTAGPTVLVGTEFMGNDAVQNGGGLFSSVDTSVTSAQFADNTGDNGAAIYHQGGILTLTSTNITGNTATSNGGGISLDGAMSKVDIIQSIITENTAVSGAGLDNTDGTITLLNGYISDNIATNNGGGANNAGTLSVVNTTFYNNTASSGSSIYNDGTLALAHSTLSGNTSSINGNLFNAATATITHTINSGNTGGDCAGSGTLTSLGYSIFGQNGSANGCNISAKDIVLTGNVGTLFETAAPANNGGSSLTFAIKLDSPAFSAGDPDFDAADFTPPNENDQRGLGFKRKVGQAIDIGAVELQNIPPQAENDTVTVFEDSNVNINVLANDLDDDLPIVMNEVVVRDVNLFINTLPQKGQLILNGNQTFTYVPNVNTPPINQNEMDSFMYDVIDPSGLTSTTSVNITIQWVNDLPVARGDNYTTTFRRTLEVNAVEGILGNDSDIEGEGFTASLVEPTRNGTVTLNPDGSFVYIPNEIFIGADLFRYQIKDTTGADSQIANVIIVVESPGVTGCEINTENLGDGLGVLFPIGALSSCNGNPVYYWKQEVGDSSTYTIYLGKPQTLTQLAYETLNATDICENGICKIDLTTKVGTAWLPNDNYWVWLCRADRSVCETSADPWLATGGTYFAIVIPNGEPVTLYPTTDTESLNPTLNWVLNGDAQNLSWFQLYLAPTNDISNPIYFNWIDRKVACGSYASLLCAFTLPAEFPLLPGVEYQLYVQGWGPAGITFGGINDTGWTGPETFLITP